MRASIWALGPLVARFGQGQVSLPGAVQLVPALWICISMVWSSLAQPLPWKMAM
ncbi:hypothetical protein WI665_00110 [Vibrio cholerae]